MIQEQWLDDRSAEEIAGKVRGALARRRISRQALADMALGRIAPGHPCYAEWRAELDSLPAQDFARFPGTGDDG